MLPCPSTSRSPKRVILVAHCCHWASSRWCRSPCHTLFSPGCTGTPAISTTCGKEVGAWGSWISRASPGPAAGAGACTGGHRRLLSKIINSSREGIGPPASRLSSQLAAAANGSDAAPGIVAGTSPPLANCGGCICGDGDEVAVASSRGATAAPPAGSGLTLSLAPLCIRETLLRPGRRGREPLCLVTTGGCNE